MTNEPALPRADTHIEIAAAHCCACDEHTNQAQLHGVLIEAATSLACHFDETGDQDVLVKDARRYLSQQFTSASLPKGL